MGGSALQLFGGGNEATKNVKIKICRGLRWLQNDIKNTAINQKRAALTEERWDLIRARWRVQGGRDLIVLGAIELGGGKLFYFLANLQNEINSFDPSIDHPIAEVLPGGFYLNCKICATGPGKRIHHGCILF